MIRLFAFLLMLLIQGVYADPKVVGTFPLSQNQFGLSNPYGVAFDSKRNEVWVNGVYSDNIVIIDTVTKKPVASIKGLSDSYLIVIDSTRSRAYAAAGYNAIQVYDTNTRVLLKTFYLNNEWLDAITLDPVDGDIYFFSYFWDSVTSKYQQTISRHDWQDFTLKSRFVFPEDAYYYAWNILIQGSKIYVPLATYDYSTYSQKGWLWVIDKTNFTLVQKVPFGVSSWPSGIVSDTSNGTVYVADLYDKIWVLHPDAMGKMAIPNTITGLTSPWNIALDTSTSRLYCPDNFSNFVYVVDTQSKKVIKALQAGYDPSNVVIDYKQGLAFVANYLSNDVSVFDLKTDTLNTTIDLRSYTPYDIALSPGSNKTLITVGMSNGLLAWNRGTGQVESFIQDTYSTPAGIAFFPNLNKAFFQSNTLYGYSYLKKFSLDNNSIEYHPAYLWSVGGISAREESGQVLVSQQYNSDPPYGSALSILDAGTEAILKNVQLGPSSDFPKGAASNPVTGKAYVALYSTHQVAVADLAQGSKYKNIPVGYFPEAVAVNPVLNKIYVSNYGSNSISVINGFTDTVTNTIAVGKSPKGIAVKKRGNRVYVANSGDNTITVIDGRTEQVSAVLPVGGSPQNVRVDELSERIYVTNYSSASITVIEDIAVIDTRPPNILHTPVMGPVPENQPVVIRAEVTDDVAVAMVTLTYWEPAQGQYWTVPMKNISGSTYEAQIPAEFLAYVQGNEVAYFIDAVDFEGNGPATGQTPGTPANPNRFAVQKTVVKLWNYVFGHVFGGFYRMTPGPSAAIGDIRDDLQGLEIATGNEEFYPLGSSGPMGRWFLFSPTGGVIFWKDTQNDEAHSSVNIYDLTGDNKLEMLGGTTSGNQIQAFDRFANWVWRYILGSHAISTPAVERLSADGTPVVFAGSFDSYLRSINGKTGTLNWAFPASNWIWSSPAVADLDGDGIKEVVFGSDAGVYNLYALNASQGTVKWRISLGGSIRASAALADLDFDGIKEVLIGSPTGIFYCLNGKTGTERWRFQTGGEIVSSAALGDLDGDGSLEIVFGSTDGFLYVLDSKGTLRWKTDLGSPIYSSPALARRGPDKKLDIYITTLAGRLVILRGTDGFLLGGFNVGAQVVSSPVVADVDGDGKLEVFFQDRKGELNSTMSGDRFWALKDMNSLVSPYSREWPMFRRDSAHTGLYPLPDAPPGKVAGLSVSAPEEGGSLNLLWTANPEPDIASYKVYRNGIFRIQLNSLSYADTGLSDGTTYTYQISAVDKAGQEGPKSDSVSGIPKDQLAPVSRIVSPQNGAKISATSITISGTAQDKGIAGVKKVEIRIFDLQEKTTTWVLASGTNIFSFTLADLKDSHVYEIASMSQDNEGNQEQISVLIKISIDLPPVKVAGLSISAPVEGGSLNLLWTANPEPDIASYKVYRNGIFRIQLNSLSYADTGLSDGTTYTYQISAVDKAGQEGPKSDSVSGIPRDVLAPVSRIILEESDTGLVGFWKFNEVTGTTAVDSAGMNHGTLVNGPVWTTGKIGGALDFDGNDYMKINDSPDLRITNAITIGAWINYRTINYAESGINIFSRAGNGYIFLIGGPDNHNSNLAVYMYGLSNPGWHKGNAVLSPNEWYHVAVTYDGSYITFYINGNVDKKISSSGSISFTTSGTYIGWSPPETGVVPGWHVPLDGLIDEVRVYNRALNADEITELYNNTLKPEYDSKMSTTTLHLSGMAKDFGISGLSKVQIRLQDLTETSETWFTADGTSSFSLNVPGILKNNHSYKAASRAIDKEGNLEQAPVNVQFSVVLPPAMVTGLTATLGPSGDSATLKWNPVSEPDIAGYRIYSGDGNLIAITTTTIFELKNLAYNTQYTYSVSAIDSAGLESLKTSVSFATSANGTAMATIRVPKDGKKIWGNAVTIMADATDSTSKVVFQYQKEGESGWTDISSADSKPPYAVYWNVSDARISTGTYYLRAKAFDSNGNPDLSPPTIRVIVGDANADIVEDGNPEVDPNVPHRKDEKISTAGSTEEVVILDGTKVIIPQGAVPEGEQIRIQVVSENEVPAQSFKSGDKVLKSAGVFRKFTFANGTSQFKEKLTLTLPVPDENGDGIVDGTDIRVSSLKVYFFSESGKKWVAVGFLNSSVQASGVWSQESGVGGLAKNQKSVSVEVDHFTLFGLFQEQEVSAGLKLGEIYAYPNPARGTEQPTLHIEVGNADKLEIRIYDISGDMIHSKDINSPPSIIDGKYAYRYTWDTSGVPSGVYIFSVQAHKNGQGSIKTKGKLGLIK